MDFDPTTAQPEQGGGGNAAPGEAASTSAPAQSGFDPTTARPEGAQSTPYSASEEGTSQMTPGIASAVTSLMHVFGESAEEGFGKGPWWSDQLETEMKKRGLYSDWEKGQIDIGHAVMRNLVLPAVSGVATGIEGAVRSLSAVSSGAAAVAAETGQVLGMPQLGREIAAVLHGEVIPEGTAHAVMTPRRVGNLPLEPGELADAGKLKIVGGDEATWQGTAALPEDAAARQATAIKTLDGQQAGLQPYGPPEAPAAGP